MDFDMMLHVMNNLITETLLTKEQLRERLNLNSIRAVDALLKTNRIPAIRISRKLTRFHWPAVEQALSRLVINAA